MEKSSLRFRWKRAFTLIEIMVVIACAMLVILPVMNVMRTGTQASFQGMQQIDAVLSGRRILNQLTRDLRMACIDTQGFPPVNGSGQEIQYALRNIVRKKDMGSQVRYVFTAFPQHGPISNAIPGYAESGNPAPAQTRALRQVMELEYLYVKAQSANSPGQLFRIERFEGRESKHLLSTSVSFFQIGIRGGDTAWSNTYYFITLQLFSGKSPVNSTAKNLPLDFYDVATPDFFAAYQQQPANRLNWYSRIRGQSDPPLYMAREFDKNL